MSLFSTQSLAGKTILVLGGTRPLSKRLELCGAKVVGNLSSSVDLLVIATGETQEERSKVVEAVAQDIPVLPASFLLDHLEPNTRRKRSRPVRSSLATPPTKRRRTHESKASESSQFLQLQATAVAQALTTALRSQAGVERCLLNRVVAFEGNIGAGKSTLCSKLKAFYGAKCGLYKEQGNEAFLQLFYSDPSKYGFAYQWGMLKTRRFQLALAQRDAKYGREPTRHFYFWDRSMLGDYVFALWNHLLGSISRAEMDVYENEFGGSMRALGALPFLRDVHCYVLLNDEPRHCKHRVEQHRGNASEAGIPLPYYDGIDDVHFELVVKRLLPLRLVPVLVLTWGQYHSPALLWALLLRVTSGAQAGASVRYVPAPPVQLAPDEVHYASGNDVLAFYAQIDCPDALAERPPEPPAVRARRVECVRAYVCQHLLRISAADKGIVVSDDYALTFYHNAYKRVVLWHLSHFHEVCFY